MQYTAHAGCPDALGFFWHVRARTQRVRLAATGELALLVAVRIEQEGNESVGTLELPAPDQSEPFVRQVRAASCEEVVLALSLVLALAYDPDAVQSFASPAPPGSPPPPPEPHRSPPPPAHPRASASETSAWRAAFGLDGLFVGGMIASSLEPGLGAFAEVGRTGGFVAPTVTASFVFVPSESHVTDVDPTARFGYVGGRLALCPVNLLSLVAKGVELSPCLALDVGRLSASTELADPLGVASSSWVASLAILRFRWNFYDRFFGETIAGAGVTLKRPPDTFRVEEQGQEKTVFEVPPVVSDFGVGVGAYFP